MRKFVSVVVSSLIGAFLLSLFVISNFSYADGNPPPTLTGYNLQTNGTLLLDVHGRPGKTFELRVSEDLDSWTDVSLLGPIQSNFSFGTIIDSNVHLLFSQVLLLPGTNPPAWQWSWDYPLAFSPDETTNLFLQWRPPFDLLDITGYRVYQDDELVAELSHTTLTYIATGLETGRLYRFRIEAGNEDNNWTSNGLALAVRPAPGDPTAMASVPGNGIPTAVGDSVRFLFEHEESVQTGVDTNEMAAHQLSVLRGRVFDISSNALGGVAISILGAPEFGNTLSRTNGCYDMAVAGGIAMSVNFSRYGYLPVQRVVDVPWQETVDIPDVFLIQNDTNLTVVSFTNGPAAQVAQGAQVSDADGTRRAMVIIPTNATASIITYAGVTQEVEQLTTRFTEYTAGSAGPGAMPGDLPESVAYTYAIELGSLEAQTKEQGRDVLFNTNVFFYVDNFIGMPPGIVVPMGYYDNQSGAWVPSPNGIVINLLGTNALGLARVCAQTNGLESSAAELEALGFTDDELLTLAQTYSPATNSLWRVPIQHFSTYDCNYGVVPEDGAEDPRLPPVTGGDLIPSPNVDCGNSGIEMENQTLTEVLRVPGTPFFLVYSSQMAAKNPKLRSLRIPVSSASVASNMTAIRVRINVAGQAHDYIFPPTTNQMLEFKWDGQDGYEREVKGAQAISYSVEYLYPGFYAMPPEMSASFGAASGQAVPGMIRSRIPAVLRQSFKSTVGTLDAASRGLGGWMLNSHHVYDPVNKNLYLGTGRIRNGVQMMKRSGETEWIMDVFAGTGERGFSGDGGPARKARLNRPQGICVGPDGSVYFADSSNARVRKIAPDGTISTYAGTSPQPDDLGDGGPATSARVQLPSHVAMGPDRSLYIVAERRVRRVTWGGRISTFAGNGNAWGAPQIPGVAATNLPIDPSGIAIARDGTMFLSDYLTNLVWRIGPDGIAQIAAGVPATYGGYDGDDLPSLQSKLSRPYGLALNRAGQLLICDKGNNMLRAATPTGFLQRYAGNGASDSDGDGDDALLAGVPNPDSVAVGRDGSVFVMQKFLTRSRLRQILTDGRILTLAGEGTEKVGFGTLAQRVELSSANYIASAPDGTLYISDNIRDQIYRLSPATRPMEQSDTLLIASEDAAELYVFDLQGRHLRTLDVMTGATNLSFAYTANGFLDRITDVNGRVTRIHRDGTGRPTSIESPGGQLLTLALDGEDQIHTVTYPDSGQYKMEYTNTLLTSFTRPLSNTSHYAYDDEGNLTRYVRASGGTGTLARTSSASGWTIIHTNPAGMEQTFETELTGEGGMWSRTHFVCGCGPDTDTYISPDGLSSNFNSDGEISLWQDGPDPRFGMQSPLKASMVYRTPGGLEMIVSNSLFATLSDEAFPQHFMFLTNRTVINGCTFLSVYDSAQRQQTEVSPMNRVSVARMDAKGRIAYTKNADLAETVFEYDANGFLYSITMGSGPLARTTTFLNDNHGNIIRITNPESVATEYQYNSGNRLTNTLMASGANTRRLKDLEGNMLAIRTPGGKSHSFEYGPAGALTRYHTPAVGGVSNTTEWTYTADDRLKTVSYADGTSEDLDYDPAGRLFMRQYGTDWEAYTYGSPVGGSQLTRVDSSSGVTIKMIYDGGLLLAEEWSGLVTGRIERAYDSNVLVTNIGVNGMSMAALIYDLDGILIQAGGMIISRSTQNGLITGTQLGVVEDDYFYNSFAEVTGYVVRVSGTPVHTAHYQRDKLGRITKSVVFDGVTTTTNEYTYDPARRYLQAITNGVTLRWHFDPDSNLTNFSRAGTTVSDAEYDAQDRLARWGSDTYGFTARGTLSTAMIAGVTHRFSYSVPGELLEVTRSSGPATNISYLTDGKGRRVARHMNGTRTHGYLYYNDLQPAAVLDADNRVTSFFVYTLGAGCPSYMIVTGRAYRIVSDHIGSPILVIDSVTGDVVQRMTYDIWGVVQTDTHPLFQPFSFAGGLHEPETGFVRFGGRDYDPTIARWTARDPLLFQGGDINLYAYAQCDPVNMLDATGHGPSRKFVGEVVGARGTAGILRPDSNVWQPARVGDELYAGDIVRSGDDPKSLAIELSSGLQIGFMKGNIEALVKEGGVQILTKTSFIGKIVDNVKVIWRKITKEEGDYGIYCLGQKG